MCSVVETLFSGFFPVFSLKIVRKELSSGMCSVVAELSSGMCSVVAELLLKFSVSLFFHHHIITMAFPFTFGPTTSSSDATTSSGILELYNSRGGSGSNYIEPSFASMALAPPAPPPFPPYMVRERCGNIQVCTGRLSCLNTHTYNLPRTGELPSRRH